MGGASRKGGRSSFSVARDRRRGRSLAGTIGRDRTTAPLSRAWCLNQRQSPDEPGEAPLAMAGIPQLPRVVSRTPRSGPGHGVLPPAAYACREEKNLLTSIILI